MNAKVLSVYDEGALENTPYIGAEGFSVLVDVDGQRTLFDAGKRGSYLIHNMDFLEIKADSIDRLVISHNHRANIGGIAKLLDNRTKPLDIYVNSSFHRLKKMFGRPLFNEERAAKINLHIMEGDTKFSDNLTAIGPFGDLEEYCLVMSTIKGPVVISSCYHCGVGPVLAKVREDFKQDPYNLIGGLHMPKANQRMVDPVADVIKEFGSPHMYLNHCSWHAITFMRVRFNLKGVDDFYVGTSVDYKVRE